MEQKFVSGAMEPCCCDPKNIQVEERREMKNGKNPDEIAVLSVFRCVVCRRRHFKMDVPPIKFKVEVP